MSASCSFVPIARNMIYLFFTCSLKWWYLMAMCFVLDLCFGSLASSKVPLLSPKTDEHVLGCSTYIFKMSDNSIKISFNRIRSCMLWLKIIYSASVVNNAISVYILLTLMRTKLPLGEIMSRHDCARVNETETLCHEKNRNPLVILS